LDKNLIFFFEFRKKFCVDSLTLPELRKAVEGAQAAKKRMETPFR
jgi:hypothetical protein